MNIVLHPARAPQTPLHKLPSRPKVPANSAQPVSFLELAHSSHRTARSFPLFSIASTLLRKNTRVGVIQFITSYRQPLQISPFVFIRLRIAFPSTPLLSTLSALPLSWFSIPFSQPPFVFSRTRSRPLRHCRPQPRCLSTWTPPAKVLCNQPFAHAPLFPTFPNQRRTDCCCLSRSRPPGQPAPAARMA